MNDTLGLASLFRARPVFLPALALLGLAASHLHAVTETDPANPAPAQTAAQLWTPERQHELFDALDLTRPELAAVNAAVAKGDLAAATHAWADYLRQRTTVSWYFDPHNPVRDANFKNKKAADDAVNGRVQGGLVNLWHVFPDNNIDWTFNETKANPPPNMEWQWQLCRMAFWDALAGAYRATGDEKYPQAWTKEFHSFMAQCPPPKQLANNVGSTWRSIECGIRMQGSFPNSFFSFLLSPSVTDEDLALFSITCLEHAHYLRSFPTSGNFLTMEMNGLFTTGCIMPEFKEAADWRTFAASKMFEQEAQQFLPDGAQFELSPSYHNVALDNITGLAKLAKQTNRISDLPAGYIAGMEKAYDYDMYLMTPDRSLPRFNDSWGGGIVADCKRALLYFPDRTDYQWIATDGKEGSPPPKLSYAFDWAGYYAMRSSWDRDANYAAFRAGPIGYGHCQQDKLDLVVYSHGQEILFSSGGGSYEQSKWRSYATDTFGHNCILVDGLAQRQQTKDRAANIAKAPVNSHWQTTPDFDFVSGVFDQGYGKEDNLIASQIRRVLFVKPDIFVVADTMMPKDDKPHTYQARWHLMPTQTKQVDETKEVFTTVDGQPNLAIVPLRKKNLTVSAVSAQETPELLGWNVRKDLVPEYVPATTVLHTRQGTGITTFLTLILPLPAGAGDPVKSVAPTKGGGPVTVTLADGRKLAISASADPTTPLEVTETLADGKPGRHVKAQ